MGWRRSGADHEPNPGAAVKRFKESLGRERILSDAEEARLLAALREPDRTVVQLALECGAHLQSELLPVTRADIDLDKARLTITATHAKNGRPRHLPLSPDMALGLTGVNVHSLRHTWASRMVEAGADLILLKELGGWSSLAMVTRYAHHRPERAVEATTRMLAARGAHPPQSSPRPLTAVSRTS